MDKLPFEILRQCMSYLGTKEKILCSSVCKSWNEKLRKIAYETVAVDSPDQFAEMYTFFNDNEDCGLFVKNLFLKECKMSAAMYTSLPSLFPNVKKFYVQDDTEFALPATQWSSKDTKTQFRKWINTIEDVTEVGSPICTDALFNGNVCPNLKSLELACLGRATNKQRIKFIKKLKKSAPNLTHLKVLFMAFTIKEIEELLNNTPNLKVLSFTEVGFLGTSAKLEMSKIEPHPTLETLCIREGSFCDAVPKWLIYFSNKFIHLKHLGINKMANNLYEGFNDCHEKEIMDWVIKLRKLEYYRVHAFELTEGIVKTMDKSGMKLKSIDLGHFDYHPKCYTWLVKSGQRKSLETISSIGWPYESIAHEFKDFIPKLSEFVELKHLSIFQNQIEVELPNKIPFDRFLKHVPKLETLTMDFGEYIVKYNKDEPMPDCKLKTLVMIEFNFNAINRFKDDEDGHCKSLKYMEETVLPNTEFIERQLEETMSIEQSSFLSLCDYKKYEDCELDTATYEVFEVL